MNDYFDLVEKMIDGNNLTLDLVNDEKEYEKGKVDLLNFFLQNGKKYVGNLQNVNIIVANERIPYSIFEIVERLNKKYGETFNFNFLVKHYDNYNRKSSEISKLWDIETIIKANSYIDSICATIKNKNLTPMEALAYIHLKVSKITTYNASNKREWFSNDQYFAGAFMKSPEFVCAGFASLEKQIIDELNMPGLKCDKIAVEYMKKDTLEYENHARLLIDIKDNKYDINGHFFSDPTWDNVGKECEPVYTDLFLPLDCHEYNKSKFDYDENASIYIPVGKYEHRIQDIQLDFLFNGEKPNYLKQEKQEEIIFNTMAKTSNKSFNDLYTMLSKMAEGTYKNQVIKQYKYFESADLKMSKQTAKEIYTQAKKNIKQEEKCC